MYETIINNSKLKVEKGKRVPQAETGLEVLEPLYLRGLGPGRAAEAGRWESMSRKLERPVSAAQLHLSPAVGHE